MRPAGTALLAIASVVLFGCASNSPSPPASAARQGPADLSAPIQQLKIPNSSWRASVASLPIPQPPVSPLEAADGDEPGQLPPLAFSAEDPASRPTAAMPGSGFIDQSFHGFARTLPASFFAADTDLGVLFGHAGGDSYAAGVGWAPVARGPRRVKVSLLRQQRVGEAFGGQWLASMQGEARKLPLLGGVNLLGELALAKRDEEAAELNDALGARVRLAKPPAGGLGYGLTLSQFGQAFQPSGSRVAAGRRRMEGDLQYPLWSQVRLTARSSYTEFGSVGAPQRCEYHSDVALAGPALVPSLKARLEASMLRALDCEGETNRLVDRWKLLLMEDDLTGWNLRMALSMVEIEFPRAGNTLVNRAYHLESRRDLRLGRYFATFGPALSLRTHSAGHIERRINAGFVFDIDSHLHNINLRMGYEALDGAERLQQREAVNVDLSYELDFGV